MAQAIGINVPRLFSIAFAVGSALAALGGALGAPLLPLEPLYPFKYLVLVLVIVALSGFRQRQGDGVRRHLRRHRRHRGSLLSAQVGAFTIYVLLIVLIVWRPDGLLSRRSPK